MLIIIILIFIISILWIQPKALGIRVGGGKGGGEGVWGGDGVRGAMREVMDIQRWDQWAMMEVRDI